MGGLSSTANSAGSAGGRLPPADSLPPPLPGGGAGLAHALVEGVLRYGTGARVALPVAPRDLLDVRLDEPRAVHEATLPVAFER